MKPTILVILDGIGYREEKFGNAFLSAKKPNFDGIVKKHGFTLLDASGYSVGLPDGQMGNSEVGHMTIGSGRIIYQDLVKIDKSIEDNSFFNNNVLKGAIDVSKNHKLHLFGLLSDGGVHSHINHLKALIKMAKENGLKNVYIHNFLDGRDTPPTSGIEYLKELESFTESINFGIISTIIGRFYAMDRDKRWDRVQKAYDMLVFGKGNIIQGIKDVEAFYQKGITDEFMEPLILNKESVVEDGDSIIFYNFRADRARELTRAFIDKDFDYFERKPIKVNYTSFTEYEKSFNIPVAFKKVDVKNVLAEVISNLNLKQLHIAETEKYAHVTFFFNGGKEKPFDNEDRIIVQSPKVKTYDLKPEMSAYEITDKIMDALNKKRYDFIVVNYANGDMVGHTAIADACKKAVESVDECLGKVYHKTMEQDGNIIITADHGNIEEIKDKDSNPVTSHSLNPVYCIVASNNKKYSLRNRGGLYDIAPTVLDLMGIKKPVEMTGTSLING